MSKQRLPFRIRSKNLESEDLPISQPQNFQHLSHIGWTDEATFELRNIPPEWKRFFQAAHIRKRDLEDPETRKAIFAVLFNKEDVTYDDMPGLGPVIYQSGETTAGAVDDQTPDSPYEPQEGEEQVEYCETQPQEEQEGGEEQGYEEQGYEEQEGTAEEGYTEEEGGEEYNGDDSYQQEHAEEGEDEGAGHREDEFVVVEGNGDARVRPFEFNEVDDPSYEDVTVGIDQEDAEEQQQTAEDFAEDGYDHAQTGTYEEDGEALGEVEPAEYEEETYEDYGQQDEEDPDAEDARMSLLA